MAELVPTSMAASELALTSEVILEAALAATSTVAADEDWLAIILLVRSLLVGWKFEKDRRRSGKAIGDQVSSQKKRVVRICLRSNSWKRWILSKGENLYFIETHPTNAWHVFLAPNVRQRVFHAHSRANGDDHVAESSRSATKMQTPFDDSNRFPT